MIVPKIKILKNLVTAFAFVLAVLIMYIQVTAFLMKGFWYAIGPLIYWTMIAALFLIRKPSRLESTRFMHWFVALATVWLPFLMSPTATHIKPLVWISVPVQAFSVIFMIVTMATLGKGFGVIAALRDVKTSGVYRIIRHPLYSGELLGGIAVIMQNLSVLNLCIFCTMVWCQVLRMQEEETILCHDETYAAYKDRVRYRLIPGIY
jgi:protein-S-isoprenylcysteine O-methyltransferase Ste14